jgi:hypothetical protein
MPKTIRITLCPDFWWQEPNGQRRLHAPSMDAKRIEGFRIEKLVNATKLQAADSDELGVGGWLTQGEADALNAREDVELTVVPKKG